MGDYISYNNDVQTIKYAILKSQYKAASGSNAIQLGLYYGVGASCPIECGVADGAKARSKL